MLGWWIGKFNIQASGRSAALFAAYKEARIWPAEKMPTDPHAPLPAVSSMDKAQKVVMFMKLLAAHAAVNGVLYDIGDIDDDAAEAEVDGADTVEALAQGQ
eukprot:COSAG01_NODE_48511_length_380_cov_1.889680_1_plen_100_part_10